MLPGHPSSLGRHSFESQPLGAASSARRMGGSRLRPTRDLEPIQQGIPLHTQQGTVEEAAANMSSPFAASQTAGAARQARGVVLCGVEEAHLTGLTGQDATRNRHTLGPDVVQQGAPSVSSLTGSLGFLPGKQEYSGSVLRLLPTPAEA